LHRVAERRLEQLVGVGVDPHRHGAGPAAFGKGDVALRGEENAAVVREHVGRLKGAAAFSFALGDAKRLAVEPLAEGELAFLRRMIAARGELELAAAEVGPHVVVEGSIERNGLAQGVVRFAAADAAGPAGREPDEDGPKSRELALRHGRVLHVHEPDGWCDSIRLSRWEIKFANAPSVTYA